MVNKIVAILKFPALAGEIIERSREELRNIRWERAAEKVVGQCSHFRGNGCRHRTYRL
jgi:hypothetical protein